MITKNKHTDEFDVSCDFSRCTVTKSYDTNDDWSEMIALLKADGWKILKVDGEWQHICPIH